MKHTKLGTLLLATLLATASHVISAQLRIKGTRLDDQVSTLKKRFQKDLQLDERSMEADLAFLRNNYDGVVQVMKAKFDLNQSMAEEAALGMWIYARTVSPFAKDANAVKKSFERIVKHDYGQMRVSSSTTQPTTVDGKKSLSTNYTMTIEVGPHTVKGNGAPVSKRVEKNQLTDFKL